MDFGTIVGYIQSALVPLITFVVLLIYTVARGRRAITSLILGLYFALLISLEFPYFDKVFSYTNKMVSNSVTTMILFAVFTIICSILMDRLLFYRIDETAFAGFGKKALLALCATILILAFSYHVLPITTLVNPGPSASFLFAPDQYFFGWLVLPLIALFFLY